MGCVSCSLSTFISIVLDALERISLCTVCAMLTCCILFTILTILIMGVGIGYHYCFVQNSVDAMAKAAKAAGALRSAPEQGHVMRSVQKAVQRGFAHRVARREADTPSLSNNISDIWLHDNLTHTNFTDFNNLTNFSNLTDFVITNFTKY